MKYIKTYKLFESDESGKITSPHVTANDYIIDEYIKFFKSDKIIPGITYTIERDQCVMEYDKLKCTSNNANKKTYYEHELIDDKYLSMALFEHMHAKFLEYRRMLFYISYYINKTGGTVEQLRNEIDIIGEKFDEFEVIKDYKIDFISLNSLCDYYKIPFNLIEEYILKVKNMTWKDIMILVKETT